MTLFSTTTLKRFSLTLIVGFGLSLQVPILNAQEIDTTPQLSLRASSDLQKLQPFVEAKNWDAGIELLKSTLRYAKPNSYDEAYGSSILSILYMQKSDYKATIKPMERAYQLGETYHYFKPKTQITRLYFLAQLYYEQGSNSKRMAIRAKYYEKASDYMETWIKQHPNPTPSGRLFYTSLLYNRAILDPSNIDETLIKRTIEQVNEGLVSTLYPKENLYVIYLAALQQEDNYVKMADILELLVDKYPSKKGYWQQLMGTYANLGIETKDKDTRLEYNLRAILTIERAQARGHMNSQKFNYNLVGLYFNIQQFGKATELLYKGLRNGSIESEQKKWELLAYSYQQINKEFQAIEVLKEATKIFPSSGQLDNQIAQIYYSLDKTPATYRHLNLALAKGNLTKLADFYYFKSYISFELLKYEEALVAIDKSAELAKKANPQLPRLRAAIVAALEERNAVKALGPAKSS